MNIIVYIFMFIIGILLGSFYTLAVYRIPLKQDITHTRSYCPKCNHKLGFFDLIPVFSYLFLGGKCRYCKEKIRPRYIILELLSGFAFLIFGFCLKINLLNIEYLKIVILLFGMLFFSTVFITIGIFKEYKKIQTSVFNFGLIVEAIYMTYIYILNANIYIYIIYLTILTFLALLNNRKNTKQITKIILFIIFIIIGFLQIEKILY